MSIFRRGRGPHALALAMTGVRMGERLLWLGARETEMFAAIAAKVGLSGQATAVAEDERGAEAFRQAAARGGVLIDLEISAGALPLPDGSFDVAVIAGPWPMAASLAAGPRAHWLPETRRVLRGGGRLLIIERFGRRRLFGLLAPGDRRDVGGQADEAALGEAGFKPARTLARREGLLFVEGFRPNQGSGIGDQGSGRVAR